MPKDVVQSRSQSGGLKSRTPSPAASALPSRSIPAHALWPAPPVYRPSPAREVLQARMPVNKLPSPHPVGQSVSRNLMMPAKGRPAPPVYQPSPAREALQAMMPAHHRAPRQFIPQAVPQIPMPPVKQRAVSPPVYQPSPARETLQAMMPATGRPVAQAVSARPKLDIRPIRPTVGARAEAANVGTASGPKPAPPVTGPQPPGTAHSAIQRYHILAGAKILNHMPAIREWGGYPYAVVNGAQLPAQEPGIHAAPNDFLANVGGNAANIVNHPGGFSLRVSNDNNMAIEDTNLNQRQPKEFYATQEVINTSNNELARVNSEFRLTPGAQTVSILTGWWSTRRLRSVTPVFNGGNADNAPQNCNEMGARVMGINAGDFGQPGGAEARALDVAWRIGGVSEQRQIALFRDNTITNEDLANLQADRYVNHRNADQVRRLQANEHARPEIGDAYMIATIGHGTPQPNGTSRVHDIASNSDRDLGWIYHFAGVVAKSGGDRVTLENYARGDGRMANADPRWYFQMYGEGLNQSFHDFHSARPDYANPVTLSVTNTNRPPWWQFW